MNLQEALQALSQEWQDRSRSLRSEQLGAVRRQPTTDFIRLYGATETLDRCVDEVERLLGDYWSHA